MSTRFRLPGPTEQRGINSIKSRIGATGPIGATGAPGATGPIGPSVWFDNLTFGLNFPIVGKNSANWLNPSTGTQYWLQPGMEDIVQEDQKLSVFNGTTVVGTVTIPNTLDKFQVGAGLNTPRSMAIAYENVIIDGAAIHLTEIGEDSVLGPVFLSDGWSQNITNINVYAFCKVNAAGTPLDNVGIPVKPLSLGSISAATNKRSRLGKNMPGGGFAGCVSIDKVVGCTANNRDDANVPNASSALYVAVSFEPTPTIPPNQSPVFRNYSPRARSISVTLHVQTKSLEGAGFKPMS